MYVCVCVLVSLTMGMENLFNKIRKKKQKHFSRDRKISTPYYGNKKKASN